MEARVIVTTELQLKAIVADAVNAAFKYSTMAVAAAPDPDPYADFKWLCTTCAGVPPSTLRIKSAAGEIPGVIKIGKRVLYEKAAVLSWLRSQHVVIPSSEQVEEEAGSQINRVLSKRLKKGGEPV